MPLVPSEYPSMASSGKPARNTSPATWLMSPAFALTTYCALAAMALNNNSPKMAVCFNLFHPKPYHTRASNDRVLARCRLARLGDAQFAVPSHYLTTESKFSSTQYPSPRSIALNARRDPSGLRWMF